jgi:hypothetical protein
MNQLQHIISILSSSDSGTTNALLQTKVLLYSIGKKDLASWVDHEIDGYSDDLELPDYRIVKATIFANITNGYYYQNHFALPIGYLTDEEYTDATHSKVTISIGQVEQIVINAEKGTNLKQDIPIDYAQYKYGKGLQKSYFISACYKQMALHSFVGILTQVRSRLLSFLLELSDQISTFPENQSMEDKLKRVDTEGLFRNIVLGDNSVVNFGNQNTISIHNEVVKGDINSLKESLLKKGFKDSDLDDLEVALNDDGPIARREVGYGKNVSSWFSRMAAKATEASWGIGIAVVTDAINEGLKQYYGWS